MTTICVIMQTDTPIYGQILPVAERNELKAHDCVAELPVIVRLFSLQGEER